jgi:hypothetical protein
MTFVSISTTGYPYCEAKAVRVPPTLHSESEPPAEGPFRGGPIRSEGAWLFGCGDRQVCRVIARLRAHSLVRVDRLLVDEPAWVTPTTRVSR